MKRIKNLLIFALLVAMIMGVFYAKAEAKRSSAGGTKTAVSAPMKDQTFTVNGVTFTMVAVEGATFIMGNTGDRKFVVFGDDEPIHRVTLSSFYIGQTEVTQELWQAVMGRNPSLFKGAKLPVEGVSWNDCQNFIKKLNALTGKTFRLPTEAEWEYAARGGKRSKSCRFSGGNDISCLGWCDSNSGKMTHEVATMNANELGLYDMSGNVCEWVNDWYGEYSYKIQRDPKGPADGTCRVYRGGSFSYCMAYCHVWDREKGEPTTRYGSLGFRIALECDK